MCPSDTTGRHKVGPYDIAKQQLLSYSMDVAVLSNGGDWFRLVLVGYRSRVEEAW